MIYVSEKEIKAYMSKRKRELSTVKRSFPKFKPGMSTAQYVKLYYSQFRENPENIFELLNQAPATILVGAEVIQETE